MKYYMLASGSGGNCTALVNDNDEILLIDCGIPLVDIKSKLNEANLSFDNIKKVLITHTHTDHIKSLRAFNPSDVYLNVANDMKEYNQYNDYEEFNLLGFNIFTLPISHDSVGTSGYVITYNNEKMAYITDAGYVSENIQQYINNCDIYCMESNHDPRMLMLTKRPMYLKQRILSTNGHLSNQDSARVLANVIGPKTKEIIFLHRSREANSEEMLAETFMQVMKNECIDLKNIKLSIARQDELVTYKDENPLFRKG